VLGEYGSVRTGDDHIHHFLDSHEAVNELLERVVIFRHDACILEVFIVDDTREENPS